MQVAIKNRYYWESGELGYDGLGNLTEQREYRSVLTYWAPEVGSHYFEYDKVSRLKSLTSTTDNPYPELAHQAAFQFDPFGSEWTSDILGTKQKLRFTGHERDLMDPTHTTDDLDYMHARHYNLNLARFLSVDPVGGDPLRPQSWNGYSYVLNNPLNFVDPTGMMWFNMNGEWTFYEGVDELSQTVVNEDGTIQETVVKGEGTLVTFDGSKRTLFGADGSTQTFPARSDRLDSNLNSQPNLQDVVGVGPIPEGRWSFNPQEIQQYSNSGAGARIREYLGGTAWPGGESSWGSQRVWLHPESYRGPRSGFTIHGGDTFGSRGCIDLACYGSAFFGTVDKSIQYIPLFVDFRKK